MLILLLVGLLTFSFNIQQVKPEPTTWTVDDDGPADFHTIQEALNSPLVNEEDTIFVYSGTYYEHVVVDKTVSLIGEDKETTIIDGSGTDTGILVTADHVTVQGFGVQNCKVGIKVESNENVISSNLVSSNGYHETELLTDQEIYQDYVSPTHRWYLHDMVNGNYTAFFDITEHTPAISVQALGHEDINQLGIGLFHDKNGDHEPQVQELVSYMDAKEQSVHTFIVNPPIGQYIIKVLGWEVLGEPGHFDLEIIRYTGYGIVFLSSRDSIITENLVTHNPVGLYLHNSYNATIQLNDAIENVGGIVLSNSTECVVSDNNASLNEFGSGIRQFGIGLTFWSVNGFYISENNVSSNTFGLWLLNSSDNELIRNDLVSNIGWGLVLYASYDNKVQSNNIFASGDGIRMMFSCHNDFRENHFESNGHAGIFLWLDNDHNNITRNKFYSNGQHGVELKFCDNNTIADNEIKFNGMNGILIIESTACTVTRNVVFSNSRGVIFFDAFDNKIYYNNIIDSWELQAADFNSANIWDNGFEGNYWSDYIGIDLCSGPNQDQPGSDGIGDAPYIIDENNQDNYPLMKPYPWDTHDIGITSLTTSKAILGEGDELPISIVLFNYGNFTESFNVTLFANSFPINEWNEITLANRTSIALQVTVGLTRGFYTMSADASQALGETYTSDNIYIFGLVKVVPLGRTRNLDGKPNTI